MSNITQLPAKQCPWDGSFSCLNSLSNMVKTLINSKTKALLPVNAIPEQERVIRRMALVEVAGILAIEYDILPFDNQEIHAAIKTITHAWLRGGASLPDGLKGAMAVKQFMQRFPARFYHDNSPYMPQQLSGYIHSTKGLHLFIPDGFREACNGYDEQATAKTLKQLGFLQTDAERLQTKQTVHTHGEARRIRVYAVKSDLLEDDFVEPANTEWALGQAGRGYENQ